MARGLRSLFLATLAHICAAAPFTHGWDSVSSQMAGNFGSWNANLFNASLPGNAAAWEWAANNYAVIALNDFLYRTSNTSSVSSQVMAARILKGYNPGIKLLWYQAADWVSQDPIVTAQILADPRMWLHDDYGNVLYFAGVPIIDRSSPIARQWFINLPLQGLNASEAATLVDGIFVDGSGYGNNYPNISDERYASSLFPGQNQMMAEAHALYDALNGGNVWGNPLVQYGYIGMVPDSDPRADWNASLFYYDSAFDEMFGSFGTLNYPADGQWNATKMEFCINAIRAATAAGHGVIVHAFPGPANTPFSSVENLTSAYPSWDGPIPRPTTAAGVQAASAEMLVQSLAPYLIIASETTFFSYAWFYDWETGYGECPQAPGSCASPPGWYPEFSKPLGAPVGPAVQNGTVWTRSFACADVYVDLSDRTQSAIIWRACTA